MFRRTILIAGLGLAALSAPASAQASPPLDTVRVASGLSLPLYVCSPPGDTDRLFIVEQRSGNTGRIKVLDLSSGLVSGTVYLSISPVATGNEQGLLGLAFHPNFATNGFFFVNYTNSSGTTIVARYQATAPFMTSATAQVGSALQIISITQPFSNHNGGWIGFGPDGYLYVAMGDGGSANDPGGNAQNINTLLGKMLRLDVDGDDFPVDPALNYAIPPTNPFVGVAGADEIWHTGLRNPWRNGFDRATGDLYIGDVGQNAVEEISFQPAGVGNLNYGWRCMEGGNCTGLSGCTCGSAALTAPIRVYPHAGGACSVTGGYVYRGTAICGLQGTYFYADYCNNQITSFRYVGGVVSAATNRTAELAPGGGLAINNVTSFGEDDSGEMYICDQGGEVFKIVPSALVDCNGNQIHDICDIDTGFSQDTNTNGIPDECESVITTFCFPGQGGVVACPCNNPPFFPDTGCNNFGGATGGAYLAGTGSASLGNDTLLLTANEENATALTIFWTGQTLISPPGAAHGAGVRCVSALHRLYSGNASGGTIARPGGQDASVSARSAAVGATIAAGQTRYYFTIYRDNFAAGPCGNPASNINLSSAVGVLWTP
ncbi:MAG: PQQ-dependent sugar dehydrogenase [Planctomycetota bacterium]